MRDVAGRRRAVIVAIMATLILSTMPAVVAGASAPPGLDRFLSALGSVESGGNYTSKNTVSGAYGKYQILPSNWRAWAKQYLGNANAPQTPANQEKVARAKVTALYHWLDSWPVVAHWWLTGDSSRNRTTWSSSSKRYVDRVMALYNAGSPVSSAVVSWKHSSETSGSITYVGSWATAKHGSYAGDAVRYSQTHGSKATFSFTGRHVIWMGPVGPTRGRAELYIDGKVVAVVDSKRSTFKPRVTLYSGKWPSSGTHTLTIRVVGSGRPVAIDEFLVQP